MTPTSLERLLCGRCRAGRLGLLVPLSWLLLTRPLFAQHPVADLAVGSPRVESDDFKLEGMGLLGYAWPVAAVQASGRYQVFDVAQAGREQSEVSWHAGAEGWGRVHAARTLALLLGGTAGIAQYSNDTVFFSPAAATDETSQMYRVSALAGAEWRPKPALTSRLRFAAGWQREVYLRTAVDQGGSLRDEDRIESRLHLRASSDAEWQALQDTLAVVTAAELETFSLSRSRATIVYDPATGFAAQADVLDAQRLDAALRLDVVVVALAAIGLAPYLYAQGRYVSTSGSGSAVAVWIPSAGVGIRTSLPSEDRSQWR